MSQSQPVKFGYVDLSSIVTDCLEGIMRVRHMGPGFDHYRLEYRAVEFEIDLLGRTIRRADTSEIHDIISVTNDRVEFVPFMI